MNRTIAAIDLSHALDIGVPVVSQFNDCQQDKIEFFPTLMNESLSISYSAVSSFYGNSYLLVTDFVFLSYIYSQTCDESK